ncbi:hypothetical protein PAXRUDRAFT_492738 [Paxillus rubicundulus Ve08.2h10]|uniref:Uncharacterized protein n=1 Tax=Paxillus rubicundulus Ve08.2h10 TaxID=930991 RepID=A0A0D0DPC3_9AGAM|nr:hypothetical protein PAXRUDRAFT_492738 [Paxillus rubicundulus Ve08.2h10]
MGVVRNQDHQPGHYVKWSLVFKGTRYFLTSARMGKMRTRTQPVLNRPAAILQFALKLSAFRLRTSDLAGQAPSSQSKLNTSFRHHRYYGTYDTMRCEHRGSHAISGSEPHRYAGMQYLSSGCLAIRCTSLVCCLWDGQIARLPTIFLDEVRPWLEATKNRA